jgi:hypothetical protein
LAAARAQSARSVVQVGLFGELKIGVPWIILEWVGLNILDLFKKKSGVGLDIRVSKWGLAFEMGYTF